MGPSFVTALSLPAPQRAGLPVHGCPENPLLLRPLFRVWRCGRAEAAQAGYQWAGHEGSRGPFPSSMDVLTAPPQENRLQTLLRLPAWPQPPTTWACPSLCLGSVRLWGSSGLGRPALSSPLSLFSQWAPQDPDCIQEHCWPCRGTPTGPKAGLASSLLRGL